MTRCEHYLVGGRVQGVGFRTATAEAAQRFGVQGWVRNLHDGRVEVLAVADADRLAKFADWLRHGPSAAVVDTVQCTAKMVETLPKKAGGFEIR